MTDRFWLVCNPERIQFHPPSFKHTDFNSASAEAERLARENPGQEFHVLASVESYQKHDVHRVQFDGGDWLKETCNGIPF